MILVKRMSYDILIGHVSSNVTKQPLDLISVLRVSTLCSLLAEQVHVEISGEKTLTEFNHVFEKMVAAAQPIPGFRRAKGGTTSQMLYNLWERYL